MLPQDSYYKDSSHILPEERSKINLEESDAIEWDLLVIAFGTIKAWKVSSFNLYPTRRNYVTVNPCDIVIEGILAFNMICIWNRPKNMLI